MKQQRLTTALRAYNNQIKQEEKKLKQLNEEINFDNTWLEEVQKAKTDLTPDEQILMGLMISEMTAKATTANIMNAKIELMKHMRQKTAKKLKKLQKKT